MCSRSAALEPAPHRTADTRRQYMRRPMRQQGRQPDSQATLSRTSRLPESTDDATATHVARLDRGAAAPHSFLRKVTIMSKDPRDAAGPVARSSLTLQPACGIVRMGLPYARDLA